MSNYPTIETFSDLAQRANIYLEMEITVKELVNLLLPANYVVQNMDRKAVAIEGSENVSVRRDELDSIVHLVGHAHIVAEKLRAIITAAKLSGEDTSARDAARDAERQLEEARARDAARPQESRLREESWRKEARELSRPVKVA